MLRFEADQGAGVPMIMCPAPADTTTTAEPRPRSRILTRSLLALLLALVCLRSFVFVWFPQVYFDSDQAVYGIMARDLAEGRALPVFMYGQRYLLAVCAWYTAPFFVVLGPDRTVLKLPILLLNVLVVLMLWRGLRREPGMTPLGTSLAILPFAMPGVVAGSRLLEHSGGNIEPFVFMLAAYFFRAKPILLGLTLGVSFLNREYTAVSLIALVMMDLFEGRFRVRVKGRILTVLVAIAAIGAGRYLGKFGSEYHGPTPTIGSPCVANLDGLFTQQLSTLLECTPQNLSDFNITSRLCAGDWAVCAGLGVWMAALLIGLVKQPPTRQELGGFPTYLILTGLGICAGFALGAPDPFDAMLIRYVLLFLLTMVGLAAYSWKRRGVREIAAVVILGIAMANLFSHVRLVREYATDPPPRDLDLLAEALLERNQHYVYADYWLAYDLTFTTQERVIANPHRGVYRMLRYFEILNQHKDEAVDILDEPLPGSEKIVRWYMIRIPEPEPPPPR